MNKPPLVRNPCHWGTLRGCLSHTDVVAPLSRFAIVPHLLPILPILPICFTMSIARHHYETLGLQPGASLDDVKQAYRRLAKTWHPDRFTESPALKQQAEEKIKAINHAYRFLRDNLQTHAVSGQVAQPSQAQQSANTTAPSSAPPSAQGTTRPTSTSTRPKITRRAATAAMAYQQGADAVKAGHYEEAIDYFGRAIRMDPTYVDAYRYRGFVYSVMGLELGAAADLRKAQTLEMERQYQTPPPPSPAVDNDRGNAPSPPAPPPPSPRPLEPWHLANALTEQAKTITRIQVSADQKLLAVATAEQQIELWNLAKGRRFSSFKAHEGAVQAIALSPDKRLLASGGDDQVVKLWHLQSGNLLRPLNGHGARISAITFASNSRLLVTASPDGTVKRWDLVIGNHCLTVANHDAPVTAIALSPDGHLLYSADSAGTILVHHLDTRELLRRLVHPDVGVTALALTPNGEFLITGDQTGAIQVWSTAEGQPIHRFEHHTAAIIELAIAPDGQTFASSSRDQTLGIWDVQKSLRAQIRHADAHDEVGGAIAWLNPQTLLSGNANGILHVWQPAAT
jgi:tetratricopeptide (TPR) repeat protein